MLRELEHGLAAARAAGAQLLLTPEAWGGGGMAPRSAHAQPGEPSDGPLLRAASDLARSYGVALALGYLERAFGNLFSAAVVYGADGCARGHYRRCHLLPGEAPQLAAGSWLTIAPLHAHRLGLSLGADILLPEPARCLALAGATLLLHLDSAQPAPPLLREWLRLRAIENGIPLAVASGRGSLSGLYLPDGGVREATGMLDVLELPETAALPRPGRRPELYGILGMIDDPAAGTQPSREGRHGHGP